MAKERKTEALVRRWLSDGGWHAEHAVEEQGSEDPRVRKLLKDASKAGDGAGHPEFVVRPTAGGDFALAVECKADPAKHGTGDGADPKATACDGALHYARHLSRGFTTVALAVSGTDAASVRTSMWLVPRGGGAPRELKTPAGKPFASLPPVAELMEAVHRDDAVLAVRQAEIDDFARRTHDLLRKVSLESREKALLAGAVLLGLLDGPFRRAWRESPGAELPDLLNDAVRRVLNRAADKGEVPRGKVDLMLNRLSFVRDHGGLREASRKDGSWPLQELVEEAEAKLAPLMRTSVNVDTVGHFYSEFMRYTATSSKEKGIVLTPPHVTSLLAEVSGVGPNDVALDLACGTGGFLIAAMERMCAMVETEAERDRIKKSQLLGIEHDGSMYTLAACNMIFRGDGKARLANADALGDEALAHLAPGGDPVADVGLINPPFSLGEGYEELRFAVRMADCLRPGGLGVAVVPMGRLMEDSPLKRELMERHTVEAAMSLPHSLFHPSKTVTVALVVRAGRPHAREARPTWFALWTDDGFEMRHQSGRKDFRGRWPAVRERWLKAWRERREAPGESALAYVGPEDEWVAEAHVRPDPRLEAETVERAAAAYASHRLWMAARTSGPEAEAPDVARWSDARMDALFEVRSGGKATRHEALAAPGPVPFVSAKDGDEGVSALTGLAPHFPGGLMSFSVNGEAGMCHYRPEPWCRSLDVLALAPKAEGDLDGLSGMLLGAIVRSAVGQSCHYGRKANWERVKGMTVRVPLTRDGLLDVAELRRVAASSRFAAAVPDA